MKKLLYQIDTDVHPAVFDNVVAYDGGADHVTAYGGVTPANVGPLVDGAIFRQWMLNIGQREALARVDWPLLVFFAGLFVVVAAPTYLARRGEDFGVRTGAVSVDLARVRERKDKVVAEFRSGSQKSLESKPNLDLIWGEARFTGPRTLEVALNAGGTRTLSGERVVINTGQRPSAPPIPELETVPYLDSTTIMELERVPEHLVVLGGGYIGLEFGQMFRRFGADVTVVQRGPQLLVAEPAAQAVGLPQRVLHHHPAPRQAADLAVQDALGEGPGQGHRGVAHVVRGHHGGRAALLPHELGEGREALARAAAHELEGQVAVGRRAVGQHRRP